MNFQRRAEDPILRKLREMENTIMAALDDKTAAIVAAVTQLGTDLTNAINDLKNNSGAPTAAQLAALDAIAASLSNLDTQVKAADPGPAPTA